jgi:hypothetical protein
MPRLEEVEQGLLESHHSITKHATSIWTDFKVSHFIFILLCFYSFYPVAYCQFTRPSPKIGFLEQRSEWWRFVSHAVLLCTLTSPCSKKNVVSLAIGIIMGAQFNNIISSLTDDIIMPPVGLVTGME